MRNKLNETTPVCAFGFEGRGFRGGFGPVDLPRPLAGVVEDSATDVERYCITEHDSTNKESTSKRNRLAPKQTNKPVDCTSDVDALCCSRFELSYKLLANGELISGLKSHKLDADDVLCKLFYE